MDENTYKTHVFLDKLLAKEDYKSNRLWREHQTMQFEYVKRLGLQSDHVFLDVACGPLRLGAALLPYLSNGLYYGMDINMSTIEAGVEKLEQDGIKPTNAVLFANDSFDFSPVSEQVDMAFSNSLFSHLTLNSILLCLVSLSRILRQGVSYHSTFFRLPEEANWADPFSRKKWDRDFQTFANKDPYHYKFSMIEFVADVAGFDVRLATDYGHPTQDMAVFTKR